ncbi:ABC transporter permease [Bradyrhizobium genomosp. I (2014)]|uniref:ABC transporter permease n=1 Tax=Bradyrhizobium genomosp. I (2014) TaxID=2683269 RepID=UPI001FCC56E5|nr:ABC transporter permease [Bradyrhizobium sp. CCBAU 43298]
MLPVLVVIPASFTSSSFVRVPPIAYSTRWYSAFIADPEWIQALFTSISVAVFTTVVATVIGTLAAIGLEQSSPKLRALALGLIISPLVVPVIMISVALYYVMRPFGLHGTQTGLVLAHTLLALPFVVINVGLSLRTVDPNCRRAAAALGADPWYSFRTVTLPLIAPGLAGAAAFAFVTSFDEVVLSIFLSGVQSKTLPVKIWEAMRIEFTPVTAVASALLLVLTFIMFATVEVMRDHANRAGDQ